MITADCSLQYSVSEIRRFKEYRWLFGLDRIRDCGKNLPFFLGWQGVSEKCQREVCTPTQNNPTINTQGQRHLSVSESCARECEPVCVCVCVRASMNICKEASWSYYDPCIMTVKAATMVTNSVKSTVPSALASRALNISSTAPLSFALCWKNTV